MMNPFYNKKKKKIIFPYKPMKDLVFIWTEPIPDRVGLILMPSAEAAFAKHQQENTGNSCGVVLAAGPGCTVDGKFVATTVKPGDRVLFDLGIPWSMEIEGVDGKMYQVRYMGERDIQGIVRDDT